jgi:hypothetical protein
MKLKTTMAATAAAMLGLALSGCVASIDRRDLTDVRRATCIYNDLEYSVGARKLVETIERNAAGDMVATEDPNGPWMTCTAVADSRAVWVVER